MVDRQGHPIHAQPSPLETTSAMSMGSLLQKHTNPNTFMRKPMGLNQTSQQHAARGLASNNAEALGCLKCKVCLESVPSKCCDRVFEHELPKCLIHTDIEEPTFQSQEHFGTGEANGNHSESSVC
eukprot:11203594-Lingulodinium_polyedra.AAC.3